MGRYLVVGNPVVTLGGEAYIPDGALIVEGRTVAEVGPAKHSRPRAPSTGCSARPTTSSCPGSSTAISTRAALEPGNGPVHLRARQRPRPFELERLSRRTSSTRSCGRSAPIPWGPDRVVDFNYGRPRIPLRQRSDLAGVGALGFRGAVGLVTRDRNTLRMHTDNETFLHRFPPELAEQVRHSSMGYAWPIEEVSRRIGDSSATGMVVTAASA